MAVFYPIIKIIEMIIPVIVSILVYKRKLNTVNYIGLLIAIIAIVCIQW
jgi:multidrug transporter EmrE-like cation transporter